MVFPLSQSHSFLRWQIALVLGVALFLLILWLSFSAPPPSPPANVDDEIVEVEPPSEIELGDAKPLLAALDASLTVVKAQSSDRTYQLGTRLVTNVEIVATLNELRAAIDRLGTGVAAQRYLRASFQFFAPRRNDVLITGYYEATLRGSRTRSATYSYPLYRVPSDLVLLNPMDFLSAPRNPPLPPLFRGRLVDGKKLIPYFTRLEIDGGQKLAGTGSELLWVDDPVEAFFTHIQGSATVTLDDGTVTQVGYAESNGHPYQPIGRLLIDQGVLQREKVNRSTLLSYLRSHPASQQQVFNYNPSYIFFREVERGPRGSSGAILTPKRSVAVDNKYFPPHLPGLLSGSQSSSSKGSSASAMPATVVISQDSGGAIKGVRRVDFFTGRGEEAENLAGSLNARGQLIFLLKRR